MSRVWFVVLALSIGLNLGLLGGRFLRDRDRPPMPLGRGPEMRGEAMPDPEAMVRRHVGRMQEQLDLSSEQRDRLESLMAETLPQMTERRRNLADARSALVDAYSGETLDEPAFRDAADRLRAAQGALDSLTTELMLRESEILTPEQRERNSRLLPWKRGPMGRRGGGPRR